MRILVGIWETCYYALTATQRVLQSCSEPVKPTVNFNHNCSILPGNYIRTTLSRSRLQRVTLRRHVLRFRSTWWNVAITMRACDSGMLLATWRREKIVLLLMGLSRVSLAVNVIIRQWRFGTRSRRDLPIAPSWDKFWTAALKTIWLMAREPCLAGKYSQIRKRRSES